MNHRVSIVVNSTSATSRLGGSEQKKPLSRLNLKWNRNARSLLESQLPLKISLFKRMCALHFFFIFYFNIVEPCAEFTCSSPLVLGVIYCVSFSGQRSTVVPTQGQSTPLNREFSSISSCSFLFCFFSFCQLIIHSQVLRLSVCCKLQAADEKKSDSPTPCVFAVVTDSLSVWRTHVWEGMRKSTKRIVHVRFQYTLRSL